MVEVLSPALPERTSGGRFSGHESFACRYGWVPKFYDLLAHRPDLVRKDEEVMVALGIGRNMVKSVRFWAQAFGLMDEGSRTPAVPTAFARWLLDLKHGEDPYLEDVGSLWLLHWRLAAMANLAAWEVAFFEIPEREILRRFLLQRVERRAVELEKKLSATTIRQHVDVFLSCYATPLVNTGQTVEESLGCPLQELGLVRLAPAGDRDELIEFPRGPWQHLSPKTFLRILLDYWQLRAPHDKTITLRALLTDFASPGLTLRLDESGIWQLMQATEQISAGLIQLTDSIERRAVVLNAADVDSAKAELEYL
jgi:hypothetical protein